MTSNVYTKSEILKNLASRGYFIDTYTLDTFFEKWKVEAIFEDEQGSEFYDKNALDLVLNNLFNAKEETKKPQNEPPIQQIQPQTPIQPTQPNIQYQNPQMPTQQQLNNAYNNVAAPQIEIKQPQIEIKEEDKQFQIDDSETANILNSISLSDGSNLIDKIKETSDLDINIEEKPIIEEKPKKQSSLDDAPKLGILEGAMQQVSPEFKEVSPEDVTAPMDFETESGDFDDMSLLSESLEAQEKFRQYVVSELSKKNLDVTPKQNEFKLDISERTLSMIARSMAKKIAKHVSMICTQDAKSSAKLADLEEVNKKLEAKARDLEEQNKKLRLLLAESNKNLNSYKPSIFGLYKKEPPKKR